MKFLTVTLFLFCFSHLAYSKSFKELKTLSFAVKTNVPGVSFQGQLNEADQVKNMNSNNKIQINIPIEKITTGISLRDKHMREKIFKGENISFNGLLKCKKECLLAGNLKIGRSLKKVEIQIIKSSSNYSGIYKLSLEKFEIDKPEFMGVAVKDEILINFDFQ